MPNTAPRRSSRRGGMAAYIAVSLPVIGMIGALGIEVVYAHVVRQQLQNAADAAGHAAVRAINGTAAGLVLARADAHRIGDRFLVDGRPYYFADSDIEFGYIDPVTKQWVTSNDHLLVTSVRVTPVEPVGLGFSRAFFGREIDVTVCGAVTIGDGNGNDGVDPIGGDGLENGSVTARVSVAGGGGPIRMTYDDNGVGGAETTVADFFTLEHPLDQIDAIPGTIGPTTKFKILVVNSDLSPGAWITINGVDTDVTTYDNHLFASLPTYTLAAGVPGAIQLTELKLNFDVEAIENCELLPTSNGAVTANKDGILGEYGGGALTVQLVEHTAVQGPKTAAGDMLPVINKAKGQLYEAQFWWEWHKAPYDGNGGHAAAWKEDFAALDCYPTEFIDTTPGGGVCP